MKHAARFCSHRVRRWREIRLHTSSPRYIGGFRVVLRFASTTKPRSVASRDLRAAEKQNMLKQNVLMQRRLVSLLLVGLLTGGGTVKAALRTEMNPAVASWLAGRANIQTWSADFTQTRKFKSLTQPLTATGRVWFAAP